MNTDCVACFELINKGIESEGLKTISDVGNSKICKCGECGALLMSTAGSWEQVIKGSTNRKQKSAKRNAA